MTCQDRDPDLLLYGLGELSAARRLASAWHLRRCPDCRTRQARLASASAQFGRSLRPPGAGRRGPVRPQTLLPAWVIATAAVALLLLTVLAVRLVARYTAPPAAVRDEGCRPGLPNDRCR